MTKNWKTTLAGIAAIISGLGPVLAGIPEGNYVPDGQSVTNILIGIGLLLAKDGDVTGGVRRQ